MTLDFCLHFACNAKLCVFERWHHTEQWRKVITVRKYNLSSGLDFVLHRHKSIETAFWSCYTSTQHFLIDFGAYASFLLNFVSIYLSKMLIFADMYW